MHVHVCFSTSFTKDEGMGVFCTFVTVYLPPWISKPFQDGLKSIFVLFFLYTLKYLDEIVQK